MMYWNNFYSPWMSFGGGLFTGLGSVLLVAVLIWSVVWKGLALWRAAKRGDKVWYIVILVVNLLGLVEIIYLLATNKKEEKEV